MEKKSLFKKIFNVSLMIISIGMIVYFCIEDNNLIILIKSFNTLNSFWLFLSIASIGVVWFIDSNILYNLVKLSSSRHLSRGQSFKSTMVGQFFSAISPFGVAGQPMQALALTGQGMTAGEALSVTVRKFLIYQTTMAAYSFIVIIFKFHFFVQRIQGFMYLSLIGFISQSIIVLLLFLFSKNKTFTTKIINFILKIISKLHIIKNPQKIGQKIEKQLQFYLDNNKQMDQNKGSSLKLYSFMFIQLTALFIIPFFVYKAFNGSSFPLFDMISAQAFVTMVSASTPLPGGSGASEGMFLVLFRLFFAPAIIKPAMLLCRFISYYSCIIVGFPFSRISGKARATVKAN